jgi:hypothetical protein
MPINVNPLGKTPPPPKRGLRIDAELASLAEGNRYPAAAPAVKSSGVC